MKFKITIGNTNSKDISSEEFFATAWAIALKISMQGLTDTEYLKSMEVIDLPLLTEVQEDPTENEVRNT